VHEHQWENVGIFTDIESGIILHHTDEEIGQTREFRAFWGCKRAISDPSQPVAVTLQ
jgi:hypothetical protein